VALRVWRRVRVAPGLTVHVSERGASLSVGGRGHWLTAGRRELPGTVGVPGAGVYYTTRLHPRWAAPQKAHGSAAGCGTYLVIVLVPWWLLSSD
jgi:hypothetical protein